MKQIFVLTALLLFRVLTVFANMVEVRTNLWRGTETMGSDWKKYLVIEASKFTQVEEGNILSISITEVASPDVYPQLLLNNSSWLIMDGTSSYPLSMEMTEVNIKITNDMISELKSGGVIIKGIGYTVTSVDIIKKIENGDTPKENPINTIWTGNRVIDWGRSDGWQTVPCSAFLHAHTGNKLRFNFSNLKIGAQGHLNTGGWAAIPDGDAFIQLEGTYFEYTITEPMLAELKKDGCIVTGVGFTLTSVTIVDPSQIPLLTCEVVSDDIKAWENGESPKLGVKLHNLESVPISATVKLSIQTDKYEPYGEYSQKILLEGGVSRTVTFDFSLIPGFYRAVVSTNYAEVGCFNIGYAPALIASPTDAQADFDAFWLDAKAELAKIAPVFSLTKLEDKSTLKRSVYLVEMQSIGNGDGIPITIRGYYAEPIKKGTYPVVITQNGYDSDGTSTPYSMDGDSNPDWIELIMSNRGQMINNRIPYKADNIYGDWFQYHFGDKDSYYYRGAFMDVVRSIDFIFSRDKVQKQNVFMQGGSQGGAFTIAGAALDDRLNAIAPSIPFMGDFPDYFQVGSWPAYTARQQQAKLGLSDADMYAFLSYFDTKNLAERITCPVIMASGLQDPVCPPHTNFAPYNNIKVGDKQYIVYPSSKHETPSSWYDTYMQFFRKHLKNTTSVITPFDSSTNENKPIYNLYGMRVNKGFKGIIIQNGKKYLNY